MSPRRRFFLVAVVVGFLVGGSIIAVGFIRDEPLDDRRVPVILVHGYDSSAESMSSLAVALRSRGREVVSVELPLRGTADIATSAGTLDDAIADTNAARVDLIGHSAGGIVVRAWLKDLAGAARARRVVTLGSPHHGTELADFAATAGPEACIDACAQLARQSSFLSDLNDGDETPGDIAYTSIWTEFDDTVTPPESAILGGAFNISVQDVCGDARLSHGDLVRDPLAVGIVLVVLERGSGSIESSTCSALRSSGETALSS
jgi:triacylglycerol lipase